MLKIVVDGIESFNDKDNSFEKADDDVIYLEHSLVSISKWESIYQKPFLSPEEKTLEEILNYLKQMIIDPNINPDALDRCSSQNLITIQEYIDSSQSATTFGLMPKHRGPGEIITSELIYYWIVSFNIPFECQYWHLNRLFSLIRICNIKNSKQKKMSRSEIAQRNREINEQRKVKLGTSG